VKIASIVGIRPQFIKLAPISEVFKGRFEHLIIHTGQHYDIEMNSSFFQQLELHKPHYNLEVGSGLHGWQTGKILEKAEKVLAVEKPILVIVYGDANSTLAGALAAAKLGIKVAHVEAGERSFAKNMPEEINRVLVDDLSDLLFAATENAVSNLQKEGITENVYNVGDVMYDALKRNLRRAEKSIILRELKQQPRSYIVVTLHRAGNVDNKEKLRKIVSALLQIDENVVFPVHPRTRKNLMTTRLYKKLEQDIKITLTPPLTYLDFLKLLSNAKKVLTDSGGIQKETYLLRVPCITLRERTELIDIVREGWNILVGSDVSKILSAVKDFEPKGEQSNPFGDGHAAEKIAKIIEEQFDLPSHQFK